MDARELVRVGLLRKEKVDEAGAGDFGACHERICRQRRDDRLGELARVAARRFCQPQRNIGREIAMLRIARALDDDRGALRLARKRGIAHAGQSAEQKLLELLLHEGKSPTV